MGSENVELPCTLRHHFAMRPGAITHQMSRKCENPNVKGGQSSDVLQDDHTKAEQWKTFKKKLQGQVRPNAGSTSRPHTIQTDH